MKKSGSLQLHPTENQIQKTYLLWLWLNYPAVHKVTFSIPNSGKRTWGYAAKLKQEGMKAGIPDLLMCFPVHPYHGLFIEFKSKKGKLTSAQKEMISELKNKGYQVFVCYSVEEAIDITIEYLGKPSHFQLTVKE